MGSRTAALIIAMSGICSDVWAEPVDFSRDILPVLASKCFACHGPESENRQADLRLDLEEGLFGSSREGIPIVKRSNLDMSELWRRISTADLEDRMPPVDAPQALTTEEVEFLKNWIEEGAPWEQHWAFQAIDAPAQPEVLDSEWVRNPIDAFILERLESLGMSPSHEADRRTLIRRLSFDLHGLPPTPAQTQAFLEDDSPDAYERIVDRLLASPRYGERWGRHWLDVAHYADTHGYDKDKRRPNAWPYRDYVIAALNDDKPYGRFVEEQIAGDILYPDDPQALVATGFIAAGPWDFVGHVELREGTVDKKITRNLDRDDMVSSTMATFTSLTVHCARCHDHKFDPISQEDYYALQAVFAGVERADRPYHVEADIHRKRRRLLLERTLLQESMETWQARLSDLSSTTLTAFAEKLTSLGQEIEVLHAAESPSNGFSSLSSAEQHTSKWVQIDLGEVSTFEAVRLVPALPTDYVPTPGFGFPIRFKIEASSNTEFAAPMMLFDQTAADHTVRTDVPFQFYVNGVEARYIRITATKLWKKQDDFVFALAELEVLANGDNIAQGATVTSSDSIDAGRWHTRFLTDGFDSRSRMGSSLESGEIAKNIERAEAEIVMTQLDRRNELLGMLSASDREDFAVLESALAKVSTQLSELPKAATVYAAATEFDAIDGFSPPKSMREIHLLHRGDVEQPLDVVAPGTVGCIAQLASRFDLPTGHEEGARRAALAHWITDEDNPLTWRSIVNRVWHYHFGQGIVATPNDFGRMGAPPTNRALLDWLATEFLKGGQSIKSLHRIIVTSATYRQSSSYHAEHAQLDSSNRYLWRMNRRQLDAEALRDTVLYISGTLDLTRGGPGFDAFVYEDDHSPRYLYAEMDPNEPSAYRRSVYRFIVRSVPDPFMTSLDCADPSQSVPVRNETLTAIQALALLNNPMVVRQARYLAARVESIAENEAAQLDSLYRLSLNRPPTSKELDVLVPYIEEHGMAAACRLMLNTNEFIYVD
jgi:hypothetical protein